MTDFCDCYYCGEGIHPAPQCENAWASDARLLQEARWLLKIFAVNYGSSLDKNPAFKAKVWAIIGNG